MNLFKHKIFYIIIIIIALIVISLVLLNTIFYNYKGKLINSINEYYETNSTTSIEEINTLIDRYKNNSVRTKKINNLIASSIDDWLNKYNTSYDSIDDLNASTTNLNNKVTNFLTNLHSLDVVDELDNYLTEINDLKESKTNYLNGLSKYNESDYNGAYSYFVKVIETDSYYEDTASLIDTCLSSTIDRIYTEVSNLTTVDDTASDEEKIPVYTSIYNYLMNELNTSSVDLSKSKTFTDLLNYDETLLTNTYVSYAKSLAKDNKYEEACNILDEGIKLLVSGEVNVASLTDLKTAYTSMLPISLIDLGSSSKEGDWIKTDVGVTNSDNHTYPKSLVFYKGKKSSYVKNTITYNLNKEYLSLDLSISLGKDTSDSKDTGTIKIKGDNKTLKNIQINSTLTEEDLNIDLKNVNKLTFEYIIKYNETNEYDIPVINVIIGNPTLNKY